MGMKIGTKGGKRTPNSSDVSKIRAISLDIWAKSWQKWRPTLFDLKNGTQRLPTNT